MRRLPAFIAACFAVCALLGALLSVWGWRAYTQPGPLAAPVFFTVARGESVRGISARLYDEARAVRSPYIIAAAARFPGAAVSLKAGEYALPAGASAKDILERLRDGRVYQRRFTVPEGLSSLQVVRLLEKVDGLDGAIGSVPAEGALLPETYHYVRGETRDAKIAQMEEAMTALLDTLWAARPEAAPALDREQVVVLASIVEKETALPAERRRIAGVFVNRLEKGMKLQSDPTVIYALTRGDIREDGQGPLGRRLLSKDLEVDSPYNTYKYAGLPPGPIANPGRASLEAVLNPERHAYYYFVADGTGGHVFAKTLAAHNRNVAAWRKIRKTRQR